MTIRNKPVDLCICIDASSSQECVFDAAINVFENISFDLRAINRHADINYGAVVFRDPVDWKPDVSYTPIDPETKNMMKEARMKYLKEIGEWDDELERQREENEKLIDTEKYPENKNVPIEFSDNIENIICEMQKVKCGGGHDEPEDWNGALRFAYGLKWREDCKKCIIIISDANAIGTRFCGYDNHNEEEEKLVEIIKILASENFISS